MKIARPSAASLLLKPTFGGNTISTATGFVVGRPEAQDVWLVTNWHVVTGRDPTTGQPIDRKTGTVQYQLVIAHHVESQLGQWHLATEELYDGSGDPLWLEHPVFGRRVDVVALPIVNRVGSQFIRYNPWDEGAALPVGIARPLSIIGFPFGQTAGGLLPVWLQGWVASEPEVDFEDLPLMLVDARTRQGQSGSPVVAYAEGGAVPMDDGSLAFLNGPAERFVGVYSGRINPESDIGLVWKRRALVEILEGRTRGASP